MTENEIEKVRQIARAEASRPGLGTIALLLASAYLALAPDSHLERVFRVISAPWTEPTACVVPACAEGAKEP